MAGPCKYQAMVACSYFSYAAKVATYSWPSQVHFCCAFRHPVTARPTLKQIPPKTQNEASKLERRESAHSLSPRSDADPGHRRYRLRLVSVSCNSRSTQNVFGYCGKPWALLKRVSPMSIIGDAGDTYNFETRGRRRHCSHMD